MKYILYHKQSYIVPEPLTKNRTCQSWRGKQIAGSNDYEALKEYAERICPLGDYYIEEQPERK